MSSKTTTPASGSAAATKKNGLSKNQKIAIYTSVGIIVLLAIIALIVLLILCCLGKGHEDSSSSESSSSHSSSSSHESSSHESSEQSSSSHESSEQSSSHESSEQSSSQESSEQSSSHESSEQSSSHESSSHESSDQSSSHESSSHESSEQSSSQESSSHESSEQSSSHESSSHESSEQSSSQESSSHESSEQSSSHESSEQSSSHASSSQESSEQSSHESSEQSSSHESSEQSSSHASSSQESSEQSSQESSEQSSSHESSSSIYSSSHESSEQSSSHESSSSIYSSSLHEVCQETALSQYFLTDGPALLNYDVEDTAYRMVLSDNGNLILLQAGTRVAQGVYDSSSNIFTYELVSGISLPNEYVNFEPPLFRFAAATTGNVFSSCTSDNAYIFVRNDISPVNQWVFNVYDVLPGYRFVTTAVSTDETRIAFVESEVTPYGSDTFVRFYRVGPGLYQPDGTFHFSEISHNIISMCFNENGTECMIGVLYFVESDATGQVIHLMRTGSSTWVETITDLPYIPVGPTAIMKKDIRNEQASYVYITNSVLGDAFAFRVDNTSKTLEFVAQISMPSVSFFGTNLDSSGFNCVNNLFVGSAGNGVTTFSYDGDVTFTFVNQLLPSGDIFFKGSTVSSTRDGERLAVYGFTSDLSRYPFITFYSPEPHHESSSSSAEHYCVGTEIAKYILTEGRTNPEDTPGPAMSSVWMAGLNGEVIFSISDGDIVEVKQGTYHEDINEYVFESFNWYMENDPDEYIDSPAPGYSGFSMDGNHIVTISKSLPHSVYTLRRLEPFPTNLWTFDGLELTDGYEFVIVAMSFYGDIIATVEKADNPYSEYTLIIRFFKLYGETYEQDGGIEFDNSIWNNDDESFTVRAVSVALSEDGLDGSLIVKTGWSSDANFLVVFHRIGNANWIYHPIFAGNVLINPETLPFMTLIRTDIRTVSVNSPKGLVLFLPNVGSANDLRAVGIDTENGTAFVISIITDESGALDFGTLSMSTSGYNCINYLYVGSLDEGVFAYSFDGQNFSLDTHIVPEYVSELFLRGVSVSSMQDGTKLVVASFVEGLLASPFFTVYSYTETLCIGSFLVNFYESGIIPYFYEVEDSTFPMFISDDAQTAFIISKETYRVLVGTMNDQTGEFSFADLQAFPYPVPDGPYASLYVQRSSFSSDGNIAVVRSSGFLVIAFFRAYQGINEWFIQNITNADPLSVNFMTVSLSLQGNILSTSEEGIGDVIVLTMYDNDGTDFTISSVLYVPPHGSGKAVTLSIALTPNGDSCVMLSRHNDDEPSDFIRFTIARREPGGNWVGETRVSEVPHASFPGDELPSLLRHDKRFSTNHMVYVRGRTKHIAFQNPVTVYDVDTVTFNLFELATIDTPYGVTGFGCTLSSSGGDCLIYLYIGCSDDNGVFIYQFDGVSTFTLVQHVPSPAPGYLDMFGGNVSTTSDGMFMLVSGRTSDPVQHYPFLNLYSSHSVCENTVYSSQFLSQVKAIDNGNSEYPYSLWVSDDDLNTIIVSSTETANRKLFQGIPYGDGGGYTFEPLQSVPPEDPFPDNYVSQTSSSGFSDDGKYIVIMSPGGAPPTVPSFVVYVGTYPGENAWKLTTVDIGLLAIPQLVAMSKSGTWALIYSSTSFGGLLSYSLSFFHRYGLEYINENNPSTIPAMVLRFPRSLAISDTPFGFLLYVIAGDFSSLYLAINITNKPTLDATVYELSSSFGVPFATGPVPSILTTDARIDGHIYIMGAPQNNSVYMFKMTFSEEGGEFLSLLTTYQDNTKNQFGCSLAISGGNCLNYLYVGSENSGVTVLSFNGILTFEYLITDDSDPPLDDFGRIIAASRSGSELAVGHLQLSVGMGNYNTMLNLYTPVTL